jgi:hypothetical protein
MIVRDFPDSGIFAGVYQNSHASPRTWSREDLVEIIQKILKTKVNLDFLLDLDPPHLEILAACIRSRMEQQEGNS